jgi:hypothetical protein
LLSRLTFWWISDLIKKGYKHGLNKNDIWELDEDESCTLLTEQLEKGSIFA